MFERFTESAKQVVVHAQDEARSLGHAYIGTEHMLLGLVAEGGGLAARVLDDLGLELTAAVADVEEIVGRGDEHAATGQIPFTPRAKATLEHALHEAQALGQAFIGTEHILLGLVDVTEGTAMRMLAAHGIGRDDVRRAVLGALGG